MAKTNTGFGLTSEAFEDGGEIPPRHARDGDNVSPLLRWNDAPQGTRSFALVIEDPDAPSGVFRHWAVFDMPPQRTELPEGAGGGDATMFREGVNDFGTAQYEGPQPPRGHGVHHYHFRLAALDIDRLDVPPGARVEEVWKAARPHVLDEAELVGTFETP